MRGHCVAPFSCCPYQGTSGCVAPSPPRGSPGGDPATAVPSASRSAAWSRSSRGGCSRRACTDSTTSCSTPVRPDSPCPSGKPAISEPRFAWRRITTQGPQWLPSLGRLAGRGQSEFLRRRENDQTARVDWPAAFPSPIARPNRVFIRDTHVVCAHVYAAVASPW